MKNVHLITKEQEGADVLHQYLYITSDEDIKEGDWVIAIEGIWKNTITKITGTPITDVWMKIILTTDPDLIAEGVQPIDDEFLEWFVKNPSCEGVEIENKKVLVGWEPDYTYEDLGIDGSKNVYHNFYKIIIPQETLEEAAEKYSDEIDRSEDGLVQHSFIKGAEWQAERMYSELELEVAFFEGRENNLTFIEWFEQFKKK